MQIYIGNLSEKIRSFDLAPLFKGYGEYPSFKFKYYFKDYRRFYYALTSDMPESLARRAITKYHMTRIKNRAIEIHAYKERSVFNERRAFGWGSKQWSSDERRNVDRRHVQSDKKIHGIKEHVEQRPARAHF